MKHVMLIVGVLICFAAARSVDSQQEGSIIYVTKVNMHRTIPPERSEMKEMIPEFDTFRSKLSFKGRESFFTGIEEDNEEEFNGGEAVQVRLRRPMTDYYFDFNNNRKVVQREFFGKYYLIEDSLKVPAWKLISESKTISGYTCKKATMSDATGKREIVAWYAEELGSYFGPEEFNGLPGIVLEVDINEGERLITAHSVIFGSLKKGELSVPTKGQRIVESEFRKMIEEHRKRMGGNNVMIRN